MYIAEASIAERLPMTSVEETAFNRHSDASHDPRLMIPVRSGKTAAYFGQIPTGLHVSEPLGQGFHNCQY